MPKKDIYLNFAVLNALVASRLSQANGGSMPDMPQELQITKEKIQEWHDSLKALGFDVAAGMLLQSISVLDYADHEQRLTLLAGAFQAQMVEANGRRFLSLTEQESKQYLDPKPFGQDVYERFEGARTDVHLASQCLALEMPAAAIFHLIRATEAALRRVFKWLPAKGKKDGSWGDLITAIKAASPTKKCPKKAMADAVCGWLEPIKQMRDSRVMHLDEPAPEMYEAERLYGLARSFMQYVAEHTGPTGRFKT